MNRGRTVVTNNFKQHWFRASVLKLLQIQSFAKFAKYSTFHCTLYIIKRYNSKEYTVKSGPMLPSLPPRLTTSPPPSQTLACLSSVTTWWGGWGCRPRKAR